jgi:hypothetical protein
MMHFGNDVLYFKEEDKLTVFKQVKIAILNRLTAQNGIRLAPYVRLLIEPLFAFNHFEDEEGATLIQHDEEYGSEGSSSDPDEDDAKKKKGGKEIKIKTKKKGNKKI